MAEGHDTHPTDGIANGLDAWASAVADSIPAVELDRVVGEDRRDGGVDRSRRRLLVAASVGLIGLGIVGAAVLVSDSDPGPADPTPVTTDPSPTSSVEGATTTTEAAPPPTTTPVVPVTLQPPDTLDEPLGRSDDGASVEISSVVEYTSAPLVDVAISPTGRWIAVNRDDQVCLLDTTDVPRTELECVDVRPSVARDSLIWSPDESSLAFHDDVFVSGNDSDISVLDIVTRTVNVATEDGTDDIEVGPVDLAPFFDTQEVLRFVRLGDDPFQPSVVAMHAVLDFPVFTIEGLPTDRRRDPATGEIAFVTQGTGDDATALLSLDLTTTTSERVVAVPLGARLAAVSGGRALVVVAGDVTSPPRFAVADLERGATLRPLPVPATDSGRSVVGVGLSPDGSTIVMIIEDRNDPAGHVLAVASVLDDGSPGDFVEIASGEEFAPNDGDPTIRPQGIGDRGEIAWTDAGRLVYALGPDRIVTLTLTP